MCSLGISLAYHVRTQYKSRFGLQSFAGNYSHDRRLERTGWLCKCEELREDKSHILSGQCKVYGDLIDRYQDFTEDENLVQLFSEVLARRAELDKQL